MGNIDKARAALDAAATLQTGEGIASKDWPEISTLLAISEAHSWFVIAESLAAIAAKHAPIPRTRFQDAPGAYL